MFYPTSVVHVNVYEVNKFLNEPYSTFLLFQIQFLHNFKSNNFNFSLLTVKVLLF